MARGAGDFKRLASLSVANMALVGFALFLNSLCLAKDR